MSVSLVAAICIGPYDALATPAPDKERTSHYALSTSGTLGAWLMAGPCQRPVPSRILPGFHSACDSDRWQVVASATGDFDWAALLHVPNGTRASAALGAWLYFEEPFVGWLLLGADGTARVAVDGKWVHVRETGHQRGHAMVPIPLRLSEGFHPLIIALERYGNRASFTAQLRSATNQRAPTRAAVYLPNGPNEATLTERLLRVIPRLSNVGQSAELELEVSLPAGGPALPRPLEIELCSSALERPLLWKAGTIAATNERTSDIRVHIPLASSVASNDQTTLSVRVDSAQIARKLWLPPSAVASTERAFRAQANLRQTDRADPYDAIYSTLQAQVSEVAQSILLPNRASLDVASRRLGELAELLEHGQNPFLRSGQVHAALRSSFDGRPTEVMTDVPRDFDLGDHSRKPLVVILHGYNSNPQRILDAFLDNVSGQPARNLRGFVLAPSAHGNSFYRGAGERSVLDAIDWAVSTYPIDETRISITGVSMGGTGAAEIAFRNAHRFAAVAPLCGYHSYFVRRDTSNKPLRPWERRLMHRFSPASWAESGNDMPMYVAHGTKDFPLENSKVLTGRYRALGYSLVEDWPNLGHSVWKRTYRDASMFRWLSQWQKDLDPPRVAIASTSVTHGRKFWLAMDHLDVSEMPATIDAHIASPTRLVIKTRGVQALSIGPTQHLDSSATWQVSIDGAELTATAGTPVRRFELRDRTWFEAHSETTEAPAEGPWAELFAEPYVVVYGSGNPTTTALNREIATRLVAPAAGVDLEIPVLSDRQYDPDNSSWTRVLYVGRVDDHLQLSKLRASLPIELSESGIRLGQTRYAAPDVGVAFVYPDPKRRERLFGIVSANGPEGLWRVLALPGLLPDFVVFDHTVDAAAGEPVLGFDASVRAAGFFRRDGSLPENFLDPFAEKASVGNASPP
ncbi:MAG TPA: hypothetical protein VIV60_22040 [Polyangiaceae bacterium]